MNRILKDAKLYQEKALPAANASASTDSIEVGKGVPESIQVRVAVEAVPSLADTKTCTTTLEHSDEAAANFVAIPEFATLVQTGAGGAGAAAAERTVYLPPSVKKFIRATSAIVADGGNNTAKKVSLEIIG